MYFGLTMKVLFHVSERIDHMGRPEHQNTIPAIVCRADLSVMWLRFGQVLPVSGAENVFVFTTKAKIKSSFNTEKSITEIKPTTNMYAVNCGVNLCSIAVQKPAFKLVSATI